VTKAEKVPVVPGRGIVLLAVVGFADVFQQNPRFVIVAPPSLETVPLASAIVMPICGAAVALRVGATA
jgi:hypothetical protein